MQEIHVLARRLEQTASQDVGRLLQLACDQIQQFLQVTYAAIGFQPASSGASIVASSGVGHEQAEVFALLAELDPDLIAVAHRDRPLHGSAADRSDMPISLAEILPALAWSVVPIPLHYRHYGWLCVAGPTTETDFTPQNECDMLQLATEIGRILDARYTAATPKPISEPDQATTPSTVGASIATDAAQRIQAEFQRATRRLQLHAELTRVLAVSSPDLHTIVAAVTHLLAEESGDACLLWLRPMAGASGPQMIIAHRDPDVQARLATQVDRTTLVGSGMLERVASSGVGLLIPNIADVLPDEQVTTDDRAFDQIANHNSIVVVPLRVRDEAFGSLALMRDYSAEAFTHEDLAMLHEIADRVALDIVNEHRFDDLRYVFDERLRSEIARRERAEEEVRRVHLDAEDKLLSRMSHELRTPLTAILGFAQLMQMEGLPSHLQEHVDHIVGGGQHLLALVDDVLEITSVQEEHMAYSRGPVDLAHVVENCVEMIQPLANRHAIKVMVDTDGEPFAMVDPWRMHQITLNLLSNAIKYNRPNGLASISIALTDDGNVALDVHDTGPGIPPDQIERLFVPFDRLGAENSSIAGTGLGLPLVRRLVEAMDGMLEVQSEVGRGTTFHIVVPAATPPIPRAIEREPLPVPPAENVG